MSFFVGFFSWSELVDDARQMITVVWKKEREKKKPTHNTDKIYIWLPRWQSVYQLPWEIKA